MEENRFTGKVKQQRQGDTPDSSTDTGVEHRHFVIEEITRRILNRVQRRHALRQNRRIVAGEYLLHGNQKRGHGFARVDVMAGSAPDRAEQLAAMRSRGGIALRGGRGLQTNLVCVQIQQFRVVNAYSDESFFASRVGIRGSLHKRVVGYARVGEDPDVIVREFITGGAG